MGTELQQPSMRSQAQTVAGGGDPVAGREASFAEIIDALRDRDLRILEGEIDCESGRELRWKLRFKSPEGWFLRLRSGFSSLAAPGFIVALSRLLARVYKILKG